MSSFKINFDRFKEFSSNESNILSNIVGLYFIKVNNLLISYPFKQSTLIYIGMSEKKTNGIGKRLHDHFNGKSGNEGLFNYIKKRGATFTYINFDILKDFWKFSIEDLESYFILDFLKHYGSYPICNNKTGFSELPKRYFEINWSVYE